MGHVRAHRFFVFWQVALDLDVHRVDIERTTADPGMKALYKHLRVCFGTSNHMHY